VDKLLQELRANIAPVHIQGANSRSILGKKHIIKILQLTIELWNRGIRLSKSIETDLLLRLCCTDQIKTAIEFGGLKRDQFAYLILMSKDLVLLFDAEQKIKSFCIGKYYSNFNLGRKKLKRLCDYYEIRSNNVNREYVENTLVERAALVRL
jgi:tRNA threonylcarbamoyladenosine modification (KEOPS) complex Cgi121 subunit